MEQKNTKRVQKKKTLREYLKKYTDLRRVKSAGNLQFVPPPDIPCNPISSFKAQTQEIIKLIRNLTHQEDILKEVQDKLQCLCSLFEGQLLKVKTDQPNITDGQEKILSPKKEEQTNPINLLHVPKVDADLIKSFENGKFTSQTISTYGSKRLKSTTGPGSIELALVNSTPEEMVIGKSTKCEKLPESAKMHPVLEKSLDFQLQDPPTRQEKRKKIYKKLSTNMHLTEIPQLPSSINI